MRSKPEANPKPILAISKSDADLELLIELVGISQAACPVLLRDLQAALGIGDLRGVERGAYLIKAAAKSLRAERTCEAAKQLESIARLGLLDRVWESFLVLQSEFERLEPALAAFAASLQGASSSG